MTKLGKDTKFMHSKMYSNTHFYQLNNLEHFKVTSFAFIVVVNFVVVAVVFVLVKVIDKR